MTLLVVSACQETTLLLDLQLADGRPQPGALRLSLYHDGILHRSTVPTGGRALPGTLLVRHLRSGPALRVQVDGLDGAGMMMEQGAAITDVAGAKENHLTLTLDAPLADSDGDGVPDAVDDCPEVADPQQNCTAAAGDLAETHDLAMVLDAAPRDLAPRDLGGLVGCPSDAIFCDDFESGDFSRWTPGLDSPRGTLTLDVDQTRPFAGQFGLHATASKSDLTGSWLRETDQSLSSLSPPFALRFRFWSSDTLDGFTLIVSLFSGDLAVSLGGADPGVWAMTEDMTSNTIDHISSQNVDTGRWICVEVVHDGAMIHLYTDGAEAISFAPTIASPFDQIGVGLTRWPARHDAEVFIDDLVLAKSRVGCN